VNLQDNKVITNHYILNWDTCRKRMNINEKKHFQITYCIFLKNNKIHQEPKYRIVCEKIFLYWNSLAFKQFIDCNRSFIGMDINSIVVV